MGVLCHKWVEDLSTLRVGLVTTMEDKLAMLDLWIKSPLIRAFCSNVWNFAKSQKEKLRKKEESREMDLLKYVSKEEEMMEEEWKRYFNFKDKNLEKRLEKAFKFKDRKLKERDLEKRGFKFKDRRLKQKYWKDKKLEKRGKKLDVSKIVKSMTGARVMKSIMKRFDVEYFNAESVGFFILIATRFFYSTYGDRCKEYCVFATSGGGVSMYDDWLFRYFEMMFKTMEKMANSKNISEELRREWCKGIFELRKEQVEYIMKKHKEKESYQYCKMVLDQLRRIKILADIKYYHVWVCYYYARLLIFAQLDKVASIDTKMNDIINYIKDALECLDEVLNSAEHMCNHEIVNLARFMARDLEKMSRLDKNDVFKFSDLASLLVKCADSLDWKLNSSV